MVSDGKKYDQNLHSEIQIYARKIDENFMNFVEKSVEGVYETAVFFRGVFGRDIRSGAEFNKFTEEELPKVLADAKICLKTLDVLAEKGCLRTRPETNGRYRQIFARIFGK